MAASRGFTTIELLMVILFFAVAMGLVTVPLANLQGKTALADGTLALKDTIRRANVQAMTGYFGDDWGIHLSNAAGCAVPATKYYLFRSGTFDAASDTTDVFDVPTGAEITDVAVGGGCDIIFTRFHGTTPNVGTVTMTGIGDGATSTISINGHGRISE